MPMRYQAVLGPADVLADRPFTDAEHTAREVEIMQLMLDEERELARAWEKAGGAAPTDLVTRDYDEAGRRHLLVVPSTRALVEACDLSAIGFFGQPRAGVDHAVLFGLEDELIGRLGAYGAVGLLSYYDVELAAPKGTYGNLILFATQDVPDEWHQDEVHRRAVALAPDHYHEIRLHKGSVLGPLLGKGQIAVERTKYFDFQGPDIWFGLRHFPA